MRYPADLDTAYERIAEDRYCSDTYSNNDDDNNNDSSHRSVNIPITWFSPTERTVDGSFDSFHLEDVEQMYIRNRNITALSKMPLYPLGIVHIPYSEANYTLNNMEMRNVNMARVSCILYVA